ncbi:zf-HC2 domain-containing protein [Streptomyces sp. ms191]|uniref:zf-HC2 domain-containing protein n=1 Tax=Streptomyces sp. ms191 TaxID=1827978 RepID=UPI0011CD9DA0|nr:zf-HC2 domain-containing protein [Streptomyces sp. ms191]TXS33789.1 zf-HC2 domain-containing protein [Streptomyces sp. ms191]
MTTPWHVTADLADRYARGAAPEPDAWSVEKHVETCGACAVRVSDAVRAGSAGPALADLRAALLDEVGREAATAPARAGRLRARIQGAGGASNAPARRDGPAVARAERPARPAGPRPPTRLARVVWAAGPALRGAWLGSLVAVAVAALGLAYGAGFRDVRPLLLAVAPVLPLAGVALSYGRHADPMDEIVAATPSGGLRLLLTRTAAVLAVSVPLLTAAGALLPAAPGVPGAAAWLLPGLALALATLALGSFVGCRAAAATLGGGWLLAVTGPVLGRPGATAELARLLSGPAVQGAWAAAAAVCAGLLALRRRSFDHLGTL